MKYCRIFLFVILFPFCAFGEEQEVEIQGQVTQSDGKAISKAVVSVDGHRTKVETDPDGNFSILLPPGTYTVVVEAPGYEDQGETISTGKEQHLQTNFILLPKHLQFEEIVLGSEELNAGVSVSSPQVTIFPGRKADSTSVLFVVTDVPSVAPLGQGGLFQVPSIRGASRERILLMLESVRVTSERRTGPSFSFVEPLLMDSLRVTRGPAPVLYGSNGETGLIQGQLLEPTTTLAEGSFRTGYQSNSNENWQVLSFKDGSGKFQYALGVARREVGDYSAGDGTEYPSGFTRTNVLAKARWLTDAGILSFAILPSWTDNIDKASSDAESRPTLYPKERHQVYQVDWQNALLQGTYDFQVQGWYHPNSLMTQDDRVTDGITTSRAEVFNDSEDYGTRFRIGREAFQTWRFWTGMDLFGRANVNATEEDFEQSGSGLVPVNSFTSIENGSYTDVGLFFTGAGSFGRVQSNGGIRVQRVHVSNDAGAPVSGSENSWSGNLGFSVPLHTNWDAVFNMGRGIRPATISEKFFTGATGRGSITGNPNLVTESNFEIDGGVRFHRDNFYGAFYLFRNDIDNFIARVRIEGDAFTYFNLPEVTISGIEGEAVYGWNDFRFYGNFHVIQGHDADDADVNDIPPFRLIAGIEFGPRKRWMGSFELVNQFKKNDPGPDEFVRDAALILNTKVEFAVWKQLTFRVAGLNLTNKNYYDSADNRAPLAIGRSASIELLAGF